jgi:predicted HTH domain antitoxin
MRAKAGVAEQAVRVIPSSGRYGKSGRRRNSAMEITVKLPDDIVEALGGGTAVPRRVLEALVLQGYLTEEISLGRLAELLGVSRPEAEAFLDTHNARLPYTPQMLEEDRRNLAEVFGNL